MQFWNYNESRILNAVSQLQLIVPRVPWRENQQVNNLQSRFGCQQTSEIIIYEIDTERGRKYG
jgi:hypothetical protein